MGHPHRRAERIISPAICPIHNEPHEPQGGGKSMGCPTCVALSREITRLAKAYNRKWAPYKYGRRWSRKPFSCVPVDTSERWPR